MYIAQTVKDRIKFLCKRKKVDMEVMLSELSLGVNAIRQINDTKGMASFSLAKIADYLDVSVDYLLGRTENPQAKFENVHYSNIVNGVNGDNSPLTIPEQNKQDDITVEFMQLFKSLDITDKIELMNLAVKKIKNDWNKLFADKKTPSLTVFTVFGGVFLHLYKNISEILTLISIHDTIYFIINTIP